VRYSLVLCATILLGGCSAPAGPGFHAGEAYLVNSQRTQFYSIGPAQVSGPDFALYHGQRLTMIDYAYGYSHVTVEATGQIGYVPTEDLAPAPPAPHPSPSPSSGATAHRRNGNDGRAPTAAEQSKIPLPEFPESEPPPGSPPFRY